MRVLNFTLIGIILTFSATQLKAQNFPNNSFEDWTMVAGVEDPDGWSTVDYIASFLGAKIDCFIKDTVAHSGDYALKLVSDFDSVGKIDAFGYTIFPFDMRSGALTGYHRASLLTNDTAIIIVRMFKHNTTTNKKELIGEGKKEFRNINVSTWSQFSVPITYTSSETPDTCLVWVENTTTDSNSFIAYDDLLFDNVQGISTAGLSEGIRVYPNPASTDLTMEIFSGYASDLAVELLDMTGRVQYELHKGRLNQGENTLNLKLTDVSPGLYLARIRTGDEYRVEKLIVR